MGYSTALLIMVFSVVTNLPSFGQCKGDFSYRTFPCDIGRATGKIEVSFKGQPQNFDLKIYSISGEIKLIKTETALLGKSAFVIEDLAPSDYLVVVKGGNGCNQTIGGIDGIHILEKVD
jgi:hypothetical protein